MSFALDEGYIPITLNQIMGFVRENINDIFSTDYTEETFLGTNFYKYFYALAQRMQENEIKTSEIFLRMQEYFVITNEKIQRPNTTHPGIYDYFLSKGYYVSTKPPEDADAGKVFICVNTDDGAGDYAGTKLALCNLVKDCVVGGVISQGTESETIVLSNGQSMDFKFNLPNKIPVLIRLTTTLSTNNQVAVDSPDDIKQKLYDNINASYNLGKDFEPQRYYSIIDAPWASSILVEWSDDDGANWHDEVYEAEYDDLFTFELTDISLVED